MQHSSSASHKKHEAVKIPLITEPKKKDEKPQEVPEKKYPFRGFGGFGPQSASTETTQGEQDFAKLIHSRYIDKEAILLSALEEYKKVGYKRTLCKITLMIFLCIGLIAFTVVSIGCWSEHLELTEHLNVYDGRYQKLRMPNNTIFEMDCPMVGLIGKYWSPSSAHLDLFGKIISIVAIRKLMQLIVRLYRCIRLKTTTVEEAKKNVDETQKDLNGLAESIIETLCEV
ncbi:unnamed protein product [Caenorhabditis bovis]|uniref:Uncharacterized protein n=1 Tax=Caenorhabditis bovis TaxID=2654633 RepID=A0A8S1EWF4_9PELO|nr:unnamed protein product [Caenorhabditis bovis]